MSQFQTWFGAWGQRGLGSLFWGYACDLFYSFLSFFVVSWTCFPLIASRLQIAQGNIFSGDIPRHCITQGSPPFVGPLPPPSLVASPPSLADFLLLRFFTTRSRPIGFSESQYIDDRHVGQLFIAPLRLN